MVPEVYAEFAVDWTDCDELAVVLSLLLVIVDDSAWVG